jgi:hypothetical protein
MIASITQIQSAVNIFMNQILICYCHSQIFKLFHIFRGSISCLYAVILACILVMRHQHVLNFLCIYFLIYLLKYIASKRRRNWKGCESSSCGIIWCTIPASASRTWGKSQSFLFSTASLWVEIWVWDLPSMKQAYYLFSHSFPPLYLEKMCFAIYSKTVYKVW